MFYFIIALALSTVTAVPVSSIHRLTSRQSGNIDPSQIPSQCQSECNPLLSTLQTCATATVSATCLCTDTVSGNFETCMNCLISINNNATAIAAAQTDASNYVSGCKAAGAPVTPITLSTGNAGGESTPTAGDGSDLPSPALSTSVDSEALSASPTFTNLPPAATANGGGFGGATSADPLKSILNQPAQTGSPSGKHGTTLKSVAARRAFANVALSTLAGVLGAVTLVW